MYVLHKAYIRLLLYSIHLVARVNDRHINSCAQLGRQIIVVEWKFENINWAYVHTHTADTLA
jgi:hypothetical protein